MRITLGVVALVVVGACETKQAEPVAAPAPKAAVAPPPAPAPTAKEIAGPAAPPTTGPVLGPKAPDPDAADARAQAIAQARAAGILGKAAQQGGAFATLGDIDDQNIYGGLLGNDVDDQASGGFGFGRSGGGPGGGTGWGTIGTGRYGTLGHGTGMRARTACTPTVSIGQPNAQGDLDKAIIRRYIKRNFAKLQYCYEKALLAQPTLAGTVQTQFVITGEGLVTGATASGVAPEVSECITNVIEAIEFPKPKAGGEVQVNYPFTFRPAEGIGCNKP